MVAQLRSLETHYLYIINTKNIEKKNIYLDRPLCDYLKYVNFIDLNRREVGDILISFFYIFLYYFNFSTFFYENTKSLLFYKKSIKF